ncbi:MAG: hypothetical protein QM723_31305 [Myxococcaceae bacterium]
MTARRKKLIPAVLLIAGATSGCDGPKKCDPAKDGACKPDGGFICESDDCFPAIGDDGGVEYDATGQPVCLC